MPLPSRLLPRIRKSVHSKYKKTPIRTRFQQGALFGLAVIMVVTIANPGYAMQLFNLANPPEMKRQNVAPLKSVPNSPLALPHGLDSLDVNAQIVESETSARYSGERKPIREIESERTAHTKTYLNSDGTKTMEFNAVQQNYLENGTWKEIDNKLEPFTESGKLGFRGSAGNVGANLRSLRSGISLKGGSDTISITPVGTADIAPKKEGDYTVIYKDAWPGVDLKYELRGEMVKEYAIIKHKSAQTVFDYTVSGGKVIVDPNTKGALLVEGVEGYHFSPLTLEVNGRGIISEERVKQTPTTSGMRVTLDGKWLQSQPDSAFPIIIDPSWTSSDPNTTYKMYKSDNYYCPMSVCLVNTGSINDGGWKHWRSYVKFPYSALKGKTILNATMKGTFQSGKGGSTTSSAISMGLASCSNAFNCFGSTVGSQTGVTTNFSINFKNKLQELVNANNFNAWWSFKGQEGSSKTFKPYYTMIATVTYDTPTPMATAASPSNGSTVVTTQPSLRVNNVTDADGDTVEYYFRVATNPDGETGAVINSGWIRSSQWTVPANILQDGRTYYWKTMVRGHAQTNPNWVRSFKVNLRTGKNSTQAYEEIGPIAVDLATGNATTSAGSHSISALGGDIGLTLNYNSPAMSSPGLVGEYWNNRTFTGNPSMTRIDPRINFSWANGSPGSSIPADNFSSRWTGYITVPTTGNYYFGCIVDDTCRIEINNALHFNRTSNSAGNSVYPSTPIYLEAGKPVPIKVEHTEGLGAAAMHLRVKGAVAEATIPPSWFQTGVRQTAQKYGLEGRYYNDPSVSRTFPSNINDPNRLLMVRHDNNLNFNWGDKSPSPGLPSNNFLVRWKGYITVPETGSYQLGGIGDDGIRIKLGTGTGGADETVLNSWSNVAGNRWGTAKTLTKNQPIPITIEYFESTGNASFRLLVQANNLTARGVPTTWLAPQATILPDGWELGLSDGDVNFERLEIQSNAAVLSDSTGQTYEYTWSGSAYKAPQNQEAILLRNDDNTHTVLDVDGKTYIFDAEGKLISVTAPEDDRQPAALKYEYAGNPSRLVKISDGVNTDRNGTLHYSGDSECEILPGFDAAPSGFLCAFKTTDGKKTLFQYESGNLARIAQPGQAFEDFEYGSFGRISAHRDTLANDAIAYGVRSKNTSVLTEISYDDLGRVESVTAPAPTHGADREEVSLNYLLNSTEFHTAGAPEPHGFSRKITYDNTFRTTSDTDVANLTTTQEWHDTKAIVLSSTDPTGLMSTTIYDTNDMPIDTYGPAPTEWFGTDRRPLPAQIHNVPRTQTAYDEGIYGAAVTWYNYRNDSLSGAPLRHMTGFDSSNPSKFWMNVATPGSPEVPVTPTNGATHVGFRATGKIHVSTTGNYTMTLSHANAARVFVDDALVLDGWSYRSNTVVTKTATIALNATKPAQFVVEYANIGGGETKFSLQLSGNGVSTLDSEWGNVMRPSYGLETSTTVYDAQAGNMSSQTAYSAPEYGQIGSTTVDPGGLDLQTTSTYETPSAGFLRQTEKILPGGSKTTYEYYEATEIRANPCDSNSNAVLQAGRIKKKTDPDPDGAGPKVGRTTETVYDAAGKIVAERYNSDSWTCITYDDRERETQKIISGLQGRTVTSTYLVDGNPLKTSVSDSYGTVTTEFNLLGRVIAYTDTNSRTTSTVYNSRGLVASKTSPVGIETFEYDDYDRLIAHKLEGETYATISYDIYGREANIAYAHGISSQINRDALGRENAITYTHSDAQTLSDTVTYSQSGKIVSGTEGGKTKSYSYDASGRLIGAEIGDDEFTYSFGVATASCSNLNDNNPNAGKSGNRTSQTINGQITTYCYDHADRLIGSGDNQYNTVEYDERGNTTKLGSGSEELVFGYDASDRNISISQNNRQVLYTRDVKDRISSREVKEGGNSTSYVKYGYSEDDENDAPAYLLDDSDAVVEKYLTLPGDVLITIRPDKTDADEQTISLPNIHGDVMATLDAEGVLLDAHMTGPFGEPLATNNNPWNTTNGTTYNYVGQHQKSTETDFSIPLIQMGARVYLPTLGRFLQIDAVEGGVDNNYVYPNDPVDSFDLNGLYAFYKQPTSIVTLRNMQQARSAARWAWNKRNQFVAWHRKHLPWLNDAASVYAMMRGGRATAGVRSGFVTASLARSQASKMGYSLSKGNPVRNSMGQQVFKKGNRYISRDVTGHNGGYWKMFNSKGQRIGTYNKDLTRRVGN